VSNGRNKSSKRDSGRDPGGFILIPWSTLDCPAYGRLSHPARSLLIEMARQFMGHNNGRLLASSAYLLKRGWKSSDVITRAKRELLAAGFIHETVKGHRPNRASWYALTWQTLDRLPGYDHGAIESFERGAHRKLGSLQIASLRPRRGAEKPSIAPLQGVASSPPTPPHGAVKGTFNHRSTPPGGNHLEKPSAESPTQHSKAAR
jgi:hypothetical protein